MSAPATMSEALASALEPPGPAVESATWTPLRSVSVGPWRVGLSGGFTRRANSAVVLDASGDPTEALDSVERLYASNGLPTILRVPAAASPQAPDPRLLRTLDARGYRTVSTTRVLARVLDGAAAGSGAAGQIAVADQPDGEWLAGWLGVKASGGVDMGIARGILTGSAGGYLTVQDGNELGGVIRAAQVGDWVALSCLAVAPGTRRRGLGRALTVAAARWGHANGARRAFLQVEVANAAALALYDDLGFSVVDEYAYRER